MSNLISGKYLAGSVSNFSKNIPSLLINASICLSALQLTPIPTGHDAPCLGNLITLTSWQNYLPPNCAPIPNFWAICSILFSASISLNALPSSFPDVYRLSYYLADAYFTVLSVNSADNPPITTAKC